MKPVPKRVYAPDHGLHRNTQAANKTLELNNLPGHLNPALTSSLNTKSTERATHLGPNPINRITKSQAYHRDHLRNQNRLSPSHTTYNHMVFNYNDTKANNEDNLATTDGTNLFPQPGKIRCPNIVLGKPHILCSQSQYNTVHLRYKPNQNKTKQVTGVAFPLPPPLRPLKQIQKHSTLPQRYKIKQRNVHTNDIATTHSTPPPPPI